MSKDKQPKSIRDLNLPEGLGDLTTNRKDGRMADILQGATPRTPEHPSTEKGKPVLPAASVDQDLLAKVRRELFGLSDSSDTSNPSQPQDTTEEKS